MVKFMIMSHKEKEQSRVFKKLIRKEITQEAASQELGLTARQIRNKMKRFKNDEIT